MINICKYCKYRNFWECKDEIELLKTNCDEFDPDYDSLDIETKNTAKKMFIALMLEKGG